MTTDDLATYWDLMGDGLVAILAAYILLGVGAWGLASLIRGVRQWKR